LSKSYHKKRDDDSDEYDNYGELKQKAVDRRKKRRFDRALKVRDIDSLLEEELWGDEIEHG
jgi:hypothetical protein